MIMHYMKNYEIRSRTICVKLSSKNNHSGPNGGKTAEDIKKEINQIYCDFKISDNELQKTFVTDSESSMRKGVSDSFVSYPCIAHRINTVVQTSISKLNLSLKMTIESCKNIVTWFKHSCNMPLLNKKLYQESTRWDSLIKMLESLKRSKDDVCSILKQKN